MRSEAGSDSVSKILAVKGVQQLGLRLVEESPDIADLYRAGSTQRKIAEKIRVSLNLQFDVGLLRRAVQFALRQIIPDDERARIAKEHMQKRGTQSFEEKSGVHAISMDERREQARMRVVNKQGLFALSPAEIRKLASDASGNFNWEGEFVDSKTNLNLGDYCYKLSNDPLFWHKEGSQKGKPNYILVANRLNEIFSDKLPKIVSSRRVAYYLNYRKTNAKKLID